MRRHHLSAHPLASAPAEAFANGLTVKVALTVTLALTGLTLASCSDSRLDPAGLKQAGKSAVDNLPPGPAARLRPGPGARHRPQPRRRPRPVTSATIPTPPYRLDVRVSPQDLSLVPPDAAVVVALRPDLPASLTALLGPHAQTLHRLPALQWLGKELLSQSLATPLGLRPRSAILVALLARSGAFDSLKNHLDAQARRAAKPGAGPQVRAALAPARLPATTIRIRIVAQVADAAKARAGVEALVARARQAGHRTIQLTSAPTTPKAWRALAARGVVAVGQGPDSAQAWTLAAGRLIVDFLLPVSGPWSTARAIKELGTLEALASLATPASPATKTSPVRPFDRVVLLSSADLSLVIRGPALAQAARWLGVRAMFPALRAVAPERLPDLVRLGWRIANLPVALQGAGPRPFDGCGVRLYLVGDHPQLRISWHLTARGRNLVDEPTAAVAGIDLARDNGLVERWLKPLAHRAPRALPPVAAFAEPGLSKKLFEGGFFMWPLALADLWPRLIPVKPVRKAVLKILRTKVRPGRFVRRINVRRQGKVLELTLEGRPPRQATNP